MPHSVTRRGAMSGLVHPATGTPFCDPCTWVGGATERTYALDELRAHRLSHEHQARWRHYVHQRDGAPPVHSRVIRLHNNTLARLEAYRYSQADTANDLVSRALDDAARNGRFDF